MLNMRYTWILLLSFTCNIYAQKTTIVVGGTLNDCPEFKQGYTRLIQGIRVFEIPSNRLIYDATSSDTTSIPMSIALNDVKVGNYRIAYSLNPGHSPYQDKYISLKAIPVNYVNFCRYDKNVEPVNPFSSCKISDTVIFENSTTGCFSHYYTKTFFIKKKEGWAIKKEAYNVVCGSESKTGKIEVSQKPTQYSKTRMVTNEDINKIILAINKIRMLLGGGCTTNSYYTIKYNNKILELHDGSCQDDLNNILFTYTKSFY